MNNQPLKLAFIAPGSLIHTVKWLNGLVSENVFVTLITQHKVTDKVDPRVSIKYLPHTGGKGYVLNALALHNEVKQLQPDVVNVHYASGYGTLALLANIKPYILSVWGSDVYEFPYQSKIKHWLIKKSLTNAEHIASTSHAMAEQTRKLLNQESLSISITPFGVNLEKFTQTQQPFTSDVITIGVVKRLEKKYGLDLLIKAFQLVRKHFLSIEPALADKLRLMIVGDGSQEKELAALSEQIDVSEYVEFVGAVENTKVPHYLNKLDIFVVPSRIESFGVAAIEALACERPCIVANTGGLPEVILNNETGLVAEYESINSIAAHIIWMLEHKDKAIEMGQKGRIDVLGKYSEAAAIQTMINVYRTFYERINK